MCLITFNWLNHPVYKLVLTANRDEFYNRPSFPLHKWEEGFFAGKDLKAGGTWLGIHPDGRFAALTNYRDMDNEKPGSLTRGELVTSFLTQNESPLAFLERLKLRKGSYNGFNLLVADADEMYFFSNYQDHIEKVGPGVHGLSNAFLDTPWPKVVKARSEMLGLLGKNDISVDDGLGLLQSKALAPQELLPSTGLAPQLEKAVSSQFIEVDDYYGTVNTTTLFWKHDGEVTIKERTVIPRVLDTHIRFFMNDHGKSEE